MNRILSLISILLVLTFIHISRSDGDRYTSRLWQWQQLMQNGQFAAAAKLEGNLNPADTESFKKIYDPGFLKKQLNTLVTLPQKTPDDFLEITRINLILGKQEEAQIAISQAYQLDPIRDDISQLYYQLAHK